MLYQLSYASVLPSSGLSPDKHTPPCLPGQLLRLTQGTNPCNRPSNLPNALNQFALISNGDLQLATPAGSDAWGFCGARPPSAGALKRSLSVYPIPPDLGNSANFPVLSTLNHATSS